MILRLKKADVKSFCSLELRVRLERLVAIGVHKSKVKACCCLAPSSRGLPIDPSIPEQGPARPIDQLGTGNEQGTACASKAAQRQETGGSKGNERHEIQP